MSRKSQYIANTQHPTSNVTQSGNVSFANVSGGTFNFNYNPTPEERRLLATLIAEVGGTCLGDCGRKLGLSKNNQPTDYCTVEYVNEAGAEPKRDYQNAVALCMECASEFPTWDDVRKVALLTRKKEKAREAEILHELSRLTPKQIKTVVQNFNAKRKESKYIELLYDPVQVDKKICDDAILRDTVRAYVKGCYYVVADSLAQTNAEDSDFDIEDFSNQIKCLYREAKKKLGTHEAIYTALVETLLQTSGGITSNRRVCEVIIAYYVQSCEVFEIPKEAQDESAE
jgi:hypothetical protein